MPLISFVVPAYNEEQNAPVLYEKVMQVMRSVHEDWEIIFVNDGSRDQTLAVIQQLSCLDKRVKYIDLSRNYGHQAALTAGLDNATGLAIISMDCDMQDPPSIIPEMISKWQEGYKVVYARRVNRKDNFLKKYTAIWYYRLLDKFSDTRIPRNVGDFRLIDRLVLNHLRTMKEHARYLRGMVAWMGFKHTFVDFDRPDRLHGKPAYTWEKSIKLAMDGLLNFSLLPLKLSFVIGLLFIFFGCLFLAYMVYDAIFNNSRYELIKWLSVVIFMAFGMQFILVWLLGEYIGRIHEETKGRPVYIINEKGNFDEDFDAELGVSSVGGRPGSSQQGNN